jgi:DNA-binding MarR family transcriptional regulator/ribosomal protein S18 acetylase RimI-like enzyme
MTTPEQIAEIRSFNRFYTKVIGLLEEGMHKTSHTLAEARVIYELNKDGVTTAAQVAAALDMDRGQMSRLMLKLVEQGLVAHLPRGEDGRSTPIALTADGRVVAERFNAMSDDIASRMLLEPLSEFERQDLVSSMRRITAMLAEPDDEPLILRPHRVGELGLLVHRQAVLYQLEQGWDGDFETLIMQVYSEFVAAKGPKGLWIAEQQGEVAGSVFILPALDGEDGTAQLRMLYTEPAFRGRGIARRLVDEAVRFSRASGYRKVILWTQDSLSSARRIYQAAGFKLVREEPHHSFGADLNGQYWALEL